MRLKLSLLILAIASIASSQVWEKSIAPGLVYHMEIDAAIPRVIHALRFSPGSPTKAMTELAGRTVYEETATKGRGTVSEIVAEQGAIAGLNGDFFPYTGDPLGAMIRSGELISVPFMPRASFGWSNEAGSGTFGIMRFHGTLRSNDNEIQIDNIDGECPQNGVTINFESAGLSFCKTPNIHVTLRVDKADISPNGTTTASVESMVADEASIVVPKGSAILVAQGNKSSQIASLRRGDKVSIKFQSDGIDWSKVDQLISGGPFLVKDGLISPDSEAERFKADFTEQRHPRSAVGRTANGDFWFVAVDGRQATSAGCTIREMGDVMFKLGCRDAINLDGGGSTDMNIFGVNVNRPSENGERPIASAILFYGPKPTKPKGECTLDGPDTLAMGSNVTLHGLEAGKTVPDAEVIWSAQGAAWIDQGGLLKPIKPGQATVTAWIRGQIVSKQITVTGNGPKLRSGSTTSRSGDRGGRKGGGRYLAKR